jgi:sugar phosphate isomerase/epimerase
VDTARDYLAVFAEIGVPAVTVHANWPPRLFSAQEGIAWQVESLRAIVEAAAKLSLRVMYEPLDTERDTPEHLAAILQALPDLLYHLDLGHANLWGRDPAAMIRRFAHRLHHIHLHDNDGRSDLHLPPGTGNINWPPGRARAQGSRLRPHHHARDILARPGLRPARQAQDGGAAGAVAGGRRPRT